MVRVLIAGLAAMLISILVGPRFIAFLRRKEYGQTIREEGPEHHVTKQGTPIMGVSFLEDFNHTVLGGLKLNYHIKDWIAIGALNMSFLDQKID